MLTKHSAMCRPRRVGRRVPPRAFTLVELLVVIGIIALLISILLPSLSHARAVAARTKCASQLHQMMLAALLHANGHRGFYPLAGVLPAVQGPGLEDPEFARYTYLSDNFQGYTRMIAPITTALAEQMHNRQSLAGTVTNDQLGDLERDPTSFIKYFTCPSQTTYIKDVTMVPELYNGAVSQDDTQVPSGGTNIQYTQFQSYIYNEYVLGWDPLATVNNPYPRLHGKADKVKHPDQTMFAADGLEQKVEAGGANGIGTYGMYTVYNATLSVRNTAPIKLSDALATTTSLAGAPACFDLLRHVQAKMNIAFCDGHVEARSINTGDLSSVYIIPPPR